LRTSTSRKIATAIGLGSRAASFTRLLRRIYRLFRDKDCLLLEINPFLMTKNGELLALAAGHFDVFLTVDAGIEYQQNLGSLALGVIALKARSNRIEDLRPLMPRVRQLLGTVAPGRWERVGE